MFNKLLIANRGEIGIRIARTAEAMGLETVAIFAPDDAKSLHVKHADQAVELPQMGVAGYLNIDAILKIAQETGCDAIHPGYGFLSERADFARACVSVGLTFVGPTPETLETQGDKWAARALAAQAGVPVPAGQGPLGSVAEAERVFQEIDGPILLKALQGGGGRGMRIVREIDDIPAAFSQCQAEALAAFGSDEIYAEQLLRNVRHVEVQILGDGQSVTHLWERDCSLQRRHQKVVEIAPAPNLPSETRDRLISSALKIGRASQLQGLATVEFLVSADGQYVFIETNPRIQVEHTVTEEITGFDLIELQLRLAAGETLDQIDPGLCDPAEPRGVSLQTRVITDRLTPEGIMPTSGQINGFQMPFGQGVRVETQGYAGYTTHPGFDPLLVKVVVHAARGGLPAVVRKAERALSEIVVTGVDTNLDLMRGLLQRPEIAVWDVSTRTLDMLLPDLSAPADSRAFIETETITHAPSMRPIPKGQCSVDAPMQGIVREIAIKVGDQFQAGQELAIIEAMKMQHAVVATESGQVEEVFDAVGDLTAQDRPILSYSPRHDSGTDETEAVIKNPEFIRPDLATLQDRLALTLDAERPKAVARRQSRGQETTRDNVSALCEGGTFHEYGQLVIAAQRRKLGVEALREISPADGIVTGLGSVNANSFGEARSQVAILAYDSTVMAGTQGVFGHRKTDRLLDKATELKLATVFLTEGGGGRPNDDDFAGTMHCALDVKTFSDFAKLRGWGPKITVNSGFCFAGNAALFGAGDIRIATRNSWIGLGGPAMIEAGGLGTHHPREVGPAPMQAEIGLVDVLVESDADAIAITRKVLSYFQGRDKEWSAEDARILRHLIPENRQRAYDVRQVITAMADNGSFLELGEQHAPGLITGFMRIQGYPMAVMANNSLHLGGALDAPASAKGARFLRLAGRFNLPVVSLCDTPGFMVGPESETQGAVGAACEFIEAGATLRSPILFVCLRKGYGIGAQAMAGGSFANPSFTISWPTGEFGAMGLEGGVRLGFKRELEAQPDAEAREALFNKLVNRAYAEGGALNVASFNEIDAVIDPADTRDWIVKGVALHQTP